MWTAGSGAAYDINYSYNANGGNVNLTGSPDYGARLSTSAIRAAAARTTRYAQFNVKSVTGPTYNSLGMESGRNLLRGCFDNRVDMAVSRDIRMGGTRALEFRLDECSTCSTR